MNKLQCATLLQQCFDDGRGAACNPCMQPNRKRHNSRSTSKQGPHLFPLPHVCVVLGKLDSQAAAQAAPLAAAGSGRGGGVVVRVGHWAAGRTGWGCAMPRALLPARRHAAPCKQPAGAAAHAACLPLTRPARGWHPQHRACLCSAQNRSLEREGVPGAGRRRGGRLSGGRWTRGDARLCW